MPRCMLQSTCCCICWSQPATCTATWHAGSSCGESMQLLWSFMSSSFCALPIAVLCWCSPCLMESLPTTSTGKPLRKHCRHRKRWCLLLSHECRSALTAENMTTAVSSLTTQVQQCHCSKIIQTQPHHKLHFFPVLCSR